MATGIVLKLKLDAAGDVKGESKVKGHIDELEIDSYSFGASNPGDLGQQTGKASISDLALMMRGSKASPVLCQACLTGDVVKEFILTCQKTVGGDQSVDFLKITLENAFISSYSHSCAGSDSAADSFTINFCKIKYEFVEQGRGAKLGAPASAAFDLESQSKV